MATTTNNGWTIPAITDYVKDGYAAIDTLGQAIDTSIGTGLLAWQTWAPTLSGGWANGNGTWDAKYCKIGKTVHVQALFTVGSTTTKGTQCFVSLPFTASSLTRFIHGINYCKVAGATVNQAMLTTIPASTTTVEVQTMGASGTYLFHTQITALIPATWATNDQILIAFTYEAA